jgi:hypothetical protein
MTVWCHVSVVTNVPTVQASTRSVILIYTAYYITFKWFSFKSYLIKRATWFLNRELGI